MKRKWRSTEKNRLDWRYTKPKTSGVNKVVHIGLHTNTVEEVWGDYIGFVWEQPKAGVHLSCYWKAETEHGTYIVTLDSEGTMTSKRKYFCEAQDEWMEDILSVEHGGLENKAKGTAQKDYDDYCRSMDTEIGKLTQAARAFSKAGAKAKPRPPASIRVWNTTLEYWVFLPTILFVLFYIFIKTAN